jgi:hypothetical protein
VLPDEVLLAIFYFYVDETSDIAFLTAFSKKDVEEWQTLAHVCWRWRGVVFGSPRRLNLRLACTPRNLARDSLNIWPALPLVILSNRYTGDLDNITAVLERNGDRVCQIKLTCPKISQLKNVWAAMQAPFPELTHLRLCSFRTVYDLPDSFLGGSAPRLQFLDLCNIPLPSLPTLLLSATHLVDLRLSDIPQPGYISPEAMVTVLSTLTSLRSLLLNFSYSLTLPDWESLRSPLSTRSVLPILTFCFEGFSKYLEDFVARIDAPRLDHVSINFFNDTVFDIPQLLQLISRTPTLKAFEKAHVWFTTCGAMLRLSSRESDYEAFIVRIRCSRSDFQVSFMEQVCTSCLPPVSRLEDLCIFKNEHSYNVWQSNIENTV